LGFNVKIQPPTPLSRQSFLNQTSASIPPIAPHTPTPPPVPAYYPEQSSPSCDPLPVVSISENIGPEIPAQINLHELNSPDLLNKASIPNLNESAEAAEKTEVPEELKESEVTELTVTPGIDDPLEETQVPEDSEVPSVPDALKVPEVSETHEVSRKPEEIKETQGPENLKEETLQSMSLKENEQLQSLIKTVAHLEQENTLLNHAIHNMLSKFDQILEVISENTLQTKQEPDPAPIDELEPVKEAMANLEKETQSLSQVLRVILDKQEESDSSLEKLETQISQIQSEKVDAKVKGGFWNKWIT